MPQFRYRIAATVSPSAVATVCGRPSVTLVTGGIVREIGLEVGTVDRAYRWQTPIVISFVANRILISQVFDELNGRFKRHGTRIPSFRKTDFSA